MLLIIDALDVRYATVGCYFMYDNSEDGNDDGDDDCGHALIPLSYHPSLISSSTQVSIVVLMNMLICCMWNICPPHRVRFELAPVAW